MAFNNNYRHSLTHSIHPNVLCYIAMVRGYLLYNLQKNNLLIMVGLISSVSVMLISISYCRSDPVLLENISSVLILLS